MTQEIELLVLANSHKYGGVCVAGVRTDKLRWVRPVSDRDNGEIAEHECLTCHGRDPEPLDTVRIFVDEHHPEPHQPENWLLTDRTWEMVKQGWTETTADCLGAVLQTGPELFGDTGRVVSSSQIVRSGVDRSLTLVQPSNVTFVDKGDDGTRAEFTLDDTTYNLSVTDRRWQTKISNHELNYFPPSAVFETGSEVLFIVSLGTEHNGSHYKLVAGVIGLSAQRLRRVRESDPNQ